MGMIVKKKYLIEETNSQKQVVLETLKRINEKEINNRAHLYHRSSISLPIHRTNPSNNKFLGLFFRPPNMQTRRLKILHLGVPKNTRKITTNGLSRVV